MARDGNLDVAVDDVVAVALLQAAEDLADAGTAGPQMWRGVLMQHLASRSLYDVRVTISSNSSPPDTSSNTRKYTPVSLKKP